MAKPSKPTPGTLYRIPEARTAEVRSPAWFRRCLPDDALLLCTGLSSQGATYLLLELTADGVRAVGLGEGEARQFLQAGDTLRGEAYVGLRGELEVLPRHLRAAVSAESA